MATVAMIGDHEVEFFTPENLTGDKYYFALSTSDSGRSQVYDRWRYLGQDGVNLKKMGLGGRVGSVVGWVDASSSALMSGARDVLTALVTDAVPKDITFADGPVVHGVVTAVSFPRIWGHNGRFCQDFILTWEELL